MVTTWEVAVSWFLAWFLVGCIGIGPHFIENECMVVGVGALDVGWTVVVGVASGVAAIRTH